MGTGSRRLEDGVYAQLSRIGKAVSAPRRLQLLELLCQGPGTVEALAGQAGISVANASQHLKVLLGARLVEAHKMGLHVEYQLADAEVSSFFVALRELGRSRLAELERMSAAHFADPGATEGVGSAELVRRIRRGEVTVIDVRPAEEYRAGHIPGALSIPVSELKRRLGVLPKDRDIVAYCRGPYCVMAAEAVALLRKRGFRAVRMEEGVVDWRARGWRVETGAAAS